VFAADGPIQRADANIINKNMINSIVVNIISRCSAAPLRLGIFALLISSILQATPVTFSSSTEFLANVAPGYYFETFESLDGSAAIPNPLPLSSNGFSYTASAAGGFFPVQPNGSWALSTATAIDPITISFTNGNVTAVGGNFFGTAFDGQVAGGTIRIDLNDGTFITLANPIDSTFTGFVSDGAPISSVIVTALQAGGAGLWPTVDNLYVGQAVPEPATAGLLIAGLSALASKRRLLRRQ
jgi:hypothetical protein